MDDTFYLLKLVINRLLSAGAMTTFLSMRATLTKIMERDFIGVLQKKMEAVYVGGSTGISLVKSKDAEKERRDGEQSDRKRETGERLDSRAGGLRFALLFLVAKRGKQTPQGRKASDEECRLES